MFFCLHYHKVAYVGWWLVFGGFFVGCFFVFFVMKSVASFGGCWGIFCIKNCVFGVVFILGLLGRCSHVGFVFIVYNLLSLLGGLLMLFKR